MSAPLTLHIVRHGEVHNPTKILYGRLPGFGLSTTGQQQASAAGAALQNRNLAAIYASPMQRAQETAGFITRARRSELPIQTHEYLNEVLSPAEGRLLEEMETIAFDLYTGNEAPYEQVHDIRRRLMAFIAEMRRKHAGQEIAAVTHGDVVVVAFLFAKGQSENEIGRGRLEELGLPERYPATASISMLVYHTDQENEVPEYQYLRPY
jgi:broad specificity phosphatase PhoE